jgi:hypothetical protein
MVEMGVRKNELTNSKSIIYRIDKDVLTGAVKRQPADPCTFSTGI